MVNYVPKIMKVMHQFKPEGQRLLLKTLRQNRGVINKRYGFIEELPSIMAKDGSYKELAKHALDKRKFYNIFSDLTIDGLKINVHSKGVHKRVSQYMSAQENIIGKKFSMIEDLSINFEQKKQSIIKIFKDRGLKGYAKDMQAAKNPEEFANMLAKGRDYLSSSACSELNKIYGRSSIRNNRNGFPLEFLQEEPKCRGKFGDALLQIQKIISPVSTDPEIVKIENILMKDYGMEYAHFGTLKDAQRALKAVKIAKAEGIPLPKAMLNSNLMAADADGFNALCSDMQNIIFLKPERDNELLREEITKCLGSVKDKKCRKYLKLMAGLNYQFWTAQENFSTKSPIHKYIHELVHSEVAGKSFFNRLTKKLSGAQKKVAEKVSYYAAVSKDYITEEVRTELRTKEILSKYQPRFAEKLTADEVKLLDYLS